MTLAPAAAKNDFTATAPPCRAALFKPRSQRSSCCLNERPAGVGGPITVGTGACGPSLLRGSCISPFNGRHHTTGLINVHPRHGKPLSYWKLKMEKPRPELAALRAEVWGRLCGRLSSLSKPTVKSRWQPQESARFISQTEKKCSGSPGIPASASSGGSVTKTPLPHLGHVTFIMWLDAFEPMSAPQFLHRLAPRIITPCDTQGI